MLSFFILFTIFTATPSITEDYLISDYKNCINKAPINDQEKLMQIICLITTSNFVNASYRLSKFIVSTHDKNLKLIASILLLNERYKVSNFDIKKELIHIKSLTDNEYIKMLIEFNLAP